MPPSGGFFFAATHIHHVWVWHFCDMPSRENEGRFQPADSIGRRNTS
jgi:hypothetical protein